jgi:hypothetical protein
MNRIGGCMVLLVVMLASLPLSGANPDPAAQIDSLMSGVSSSTSGAAVLVIKDGRPVFEHG